MMGRAIVGMRGPQDPRRESRRCPAIMLAVSRTAKVMGRISSLIVSMITIRGINGAGVPWGVRWVIRSFVYLMMEKVIIPIHNDEEKDKVNLRWLVGVKMYGNSPIILFTIMIKNIEMNRIILEGENLISDLNSLINRSEIR